MALCLESLQQLVTIKLLASIAPDEVCIDKAQQLQCKTENEYVGFEGMTQSITCLVDFVYLFCNLTLKQALPLATIYIYTEF